MTLHSEKSTLILEKSTLNSENGLYSWKSLKSIFPILKSIFPILKSICTSSYIYIFDFGMTYQLMSTGSHFTNIKIFIANDIIMLLVNL